MSHADLQTAEQSALDELEQAKSVSKQAIAASEACASQVSLLYEHSLHMAVFFLTKLKCRNSVKFACVDHRRIARDEGVSWKSLARSVACSPIFTYRCFVTCKALERKEQICSDVKERNVLHFCRHFLPSLDATRCFFPVKESASRLKERALKLATPAMENAEMAKKLLLRAEDQKVKQIHVTEQERLAELLFPLSLKVLNLGASAPFARSLRHASELYKKR